MKRRASRWLLQGSMLNLRPPAPGDLPRLAAFLGRRDLVRSPLFGSQLPDGKLVPARPASADPRRRPLALAAFDPLGSPAGLFLLSPGESGRTLDLAFAVPSDGEHLLREALRLLVFEVRRRAPVESLVVGSAEPTPLLAGILESLGFQGDGVRGWTLPLADRRPSMRIVRGR